MLIPRYALKNENPKKKKQKKQSDLLKSKRLVY